MQTFLAHSKKLLLLIQSERQTLKESLTQQEACVLMQQHYQDPLFTRQTLGSVNLHMSALTISSSLFTRETGQSSRSAIPNSYE